MKPVRLQMSAFARKYTENKRRESPAIKTRGYTTKISHGESPVPFDRRAHGLIDLCVANLMIDFFNSQYCPMSSIGAGGPLYPRGPGLKPNKPLYRSAPGYGCPYKTQRCPAGIS